MVENRIEKTASNEAQVSALTMPYDSDQRIPDYLFEMLSGRSREAGFREVVDKIVRRVRDSEIAQRMIDKVRRYLETKNPSDDLSPAEVSSIYRQDDYGDDFDMPGGKELDVGWTNHAEYRCDLRDIDPSKINEQIRNFAELHPHKHQKVNLTRGQGKAVVDVNTMVDPEEAEVVTVIASGLLRVATLRVLLEPGSFSDYGHEKMISKRGEVEVWAGEYGTQRYIHRDASGVIDGAFLIGRKKGEKHWKELLVHTREDSRRQGIARVLTQWAIRDHGPIEDADGYTQDGKNLRRSVPLREASVKVPKATGDCYESAGNYMMDEGPKTNAVLVQGEVLGQGPLEGIRFGHSWIEKGGMVLEVANGKKIWFPMDLYYRIGDITRTKKYTYAEAIRWMLKTGNYGPWELKTAR